MFSPMLCTFLPSLLLFAAPRSLFRNSAKRQGRKVIHLCLPRLLSSPLLLDVTGDRTQHKEKSRSRHRSHQVPPTCHKSCVRVCLTILRRWIEGEGSWVVMLITAEIHFSHFCPFQIRAKEILGCEKNFMTHFSFIKLGHAH